MDRRYREARTSDGVRASRSGDQQREALVRAQLMMARRKSRSIGARGYEDGPKTTDPYGGGRVSGARAEVRRSASRLFEEEGSGAFGASALPIDSPEAGIRSRSRGAALPEL